MIAALIWWAWFLGGENQKRNRIILLSTLFGAFGAMFTARCLALLLPFRFRPIHNPDMAFQLPYGMLREALDGWSSFPSDHAALFFALSAGVWLVSRRIGMIALIHTVFVIAFPRMYLGLHYPTDIVAGAAIGLLWIAVARLGLVQRLSARPALIWCEHHAPSFYGALFLMTEQLATIFEDTRTIGAVLLALLKRLL